jgi:leucyl aminopeptidase
MKSLAITANFIEANVEALVIVIFKGEKSPTDHLSALDKITGGLVSAVLAGDEFNGEEGETAYLHFLPSGKVKARRILLVGGGDRNDFNLPAVSRAAGTAVRFLRKNKIRSFALDPRLTEPAAAIAEAAVQGFITGQFELDKYRTKDIDKKPKPVETFGLFVAGAKPAEIKAGLERGQIIGESMNFTRDLANEPPNILTPTEMANRASKMAKECGLKCEILDEARMKKLGMGSLLSVSRGSEQPAKLIVLKYTPAKAKSAKSEVLGFVGKGITFDTGGISLKPSEGMDAMKYDMSGGAAVIGAMRAIALLKPNVPVIGVVAAVENMPDGNASRPSDVVTAMNGKTIEILNTDAEGRLILADAVAYAEKQGATRIIDLATLTGAVVIALGDQYTGVMGNDQEFIDEVISCGREAGESIWQLPVGKEYSKMIRSDIADIKNIGPRGKAGTIMGAVFIQEFVEKAKWAHLDIAGTAWLDNPKPYQAKGPTAVGVRTLVKFTERFK